MIELTVGISAAVKAYELFRKGLDAGKEIEECSAQVKSFFKAKSKVEAVVQKAEENDQLDSLYAAIDVCLLYTSPSPRDRTRSRMPSSA